MPASRHVLLFDRHHPPLSAAMAAAPPLNDIKAGARQKSNGTSEAPRKKVRVHSMKVAQRMHKGNAFIPGILIG